MAFRRREERGRLELLPMVDIIFLILIFFIVANGVMTMEVQKRLVELPTDEFVQQLAPSSSSKIPSKIPPELLIQIERDEETEEELFFLVQPGMSLDQVRQLYPDGLPIHTVLEEVQKLGLHTRESEVKPVIKIRPNKRTSYGTVMQIMAVCKGSEVEPLIENVTFAVKMRDLTSSR